MAEWSRVLNSCPRAIIVMFYSSSTAMTYDIFGFSEFFTDFFFVQFQGGQGFESQPEMTIFQHPSTPIRGHRYWMDLWPNQKIRKRHFFQDIQNSF